MAKNEFYSLKRILKEKADVNIVYGERSSGKTFSALEFAVRDYVKNGNQAVYMRRQKDEIDGAKKTDIFGGLVSTDKIKEITDGVYDNVYVRGTKAYLATYNEDGKMIRDERPFMHFIIISLQQKFKSLAYPDVRNVIYDEFLTRTGEIADEWSQYQNALSTVIRRRDNVRIFLLGNTVNPFSIYFEHYGIRDQVRKMKPGDVYVMTTRAGLKIAVEYTEPNVTAQKSSKYFDLGDSTGNMIVSGGWETAHYPKPPAFDKQDIYFTYFIIYSGYILQCEMISTGDQLFTFIHEKTTPMKNEDEDYIFSLDYDPRRNWHIKMNKNADKMSRFIYDDIAAARVYFSKDDVGEIFRNFYQRSCNATFYA